MNEAGTIMADERPRCCIPSDKDMPDGTTDD